MPREITLGLAFTDDELTRAILLLQSDPEHFHDRCRDEIVKPSLERINITLQQDNDPDWLAYFLEHALTVTREGLFPQLNANTENQDERTTG